MSFGYTHIYIQPVAFLRGGLGGLWLPQIFGWPLLDPPQFCA